MTNKQWAIWQMIDMSEEEMARFIYRLSILNFSKSLPVPRNHKKSMEEHAYWLKQEHKDD